MNIENVDKAVKLRDEYAVIVEKEKHFSNVEYYAPRTIMAEAPNAKAWIDVEMLGEEATTQILSIIKEKLATQRREILSQIEAL